MSMKVAVCAKTRDVKFFQNIFLLIQHPFNVLPWLTHKSAPFCSMHVHDITVFDERHLDHYQ